MENKLYIYRLKVILKDVKPEVWREFTVPSTTPLDFLHDAIQAVMGWHDTHLHEFVIKGEKYTEYPPEGVPPMIAEEIKAENHDESLFRLGDLVTKRGQTFDYLYDFGDYWMHQIKLLERFEVDDPMAFKFSCLDGENACPPDDSGGAFGYMEMMKVINDSKHPEHEDILMWLGGDFEPTYFDIEESESHLSWLQRWTRKRSLWWF